MSTDGNEIRKKKAGNKQKNEATKKRFGPLTTQAWDDIIGQRIAQAMKHGEFDNLPGKGKPQRLQNNPFAGDNQLAFDVMQNNDIAPSWIERRKKIMKRIEALRAEIQEYSERYRSSLAAVPELDRRAKITAEWTQITDDWKENIAVLNTEIHALNLEQPLVEMEIYKLSLKEELAKAGIN